MDKLKKMEVLKQNEIVQNKIHEKKSEKITTIIKTV